MTSPYKLLVVDIDGTLVGRDGSISSEDSEALDNARQSGIEVSLSTGRTAQACLRIIDRLSLDGCHIFFDGALVSNPKQSRAIYVRPLDSELVVEVVAFARRNDIELELYSASRFFIERETWTTEIRRQFFDLEPTVVDFTDLWKQETIIKAQLVASSAQEIAQAENLDHHFNGRLRFSWAKTPAYPDINFINIVDPEVSKGKALAALADHLGVSLREVVAIGDGVNDIPLLSAAGLAIVMADAPDEVRAVADYITLDVEHSGLAAAISQFLL